MGGLRIAVLGPLRAWRGQRELEAGSAQQRAVLAALALRRGRVASSAELVQDVWGAHPPASAPAALRNYVSRLRTALETGSGAPEVLVSRAGGYALRLNARALDVAEAEWLGAEAEAARARGDLASATRLLGRAEGLWDGAPLAGVPGEYAERHRDRLSEYRLVLTETRLELELHLGRHARAVTELTALADEHPLREGLRALQMVALYRCGRQGEALAAFAAARRLLAEELGVDPGPALAGLHQRILEADPALSAPSSLPAPSEVASPPADERAGEQAGSGRQTRPAWPRPAQLPPDTPDFTGREEEVAGVGAALVGGAPGRGTAPVVCMIHGMGGVGKTALAVHAAHAVRDRFPGGQLYADLRGAGREAVDPYDVQELFLRALGVAPGSVPRDRDERTALYRSWLADRRLLLLLDNAADTRQVDALLPGTSGSAVLVTSRNPLIFLPAAGRTVLEPLSERDARSLLERIVGADRCRREPQATQDLVHACGMLPLAVRIVGTRLAARPRWSLSFVASRLGDRGQRLSELESGDLAVEHVFRLGYSALDADQARAFRLLAIPEITDVSSAVAAAVLQCEPRAAEAVLDDLAHVGLLEPGDPGRYRYHDLLRLFARHRTLESDDPEVRREALSRTAGFHLSGMAAALRAEWPHSRLPAAAERQDLPGGPVLPDASRAQQWVINELGAMLAVAGQIIDHPHRPVGAQDTRTLASLLVLLMPYTDLCLPWHLLEGQARKLLDAASRHGESTAEVFCCVVAAIACARTGRHEEARDLALRALETPGPPQQLLAHRLVHVMGMVAAVRPGGLEEAITHFRRGQAMSRRIGEFGVAAQCEFGLVRAYLADDRPQEALEAARDALASCLEAESPACAALARRALGEALAALGRHGEAMAEYHEALELCEAGGMRTQHAHTLLSCASALTDAGRLEEARPFARQALAALAELGDGAGEQRARAILDRT
ncbi:BTAD domain-containing putative transcriptional regulator [Streptomyces erythrochromogenes]|uniref:AfsR/SARP family transcriptional regulator n=1 Tax=Streptomyces erythrochromogenes TaxID=285574 RepID=UPI0038239380